MSLFRQWQLLEVLMPTLMVLRPVERVLVWNLGYVEDALAVTLAHLHYGSAKAAQLLVFHSGTPPARQPVQWARADLRGVPKEPWLEPSPGRPSRWTPHKRALESVLLTAPPGPVDLLVGGATAGGGGEAGSPLAAVRQGGHLLLAEPAPRGALPASEWALAGFSGRLYRKLTPAGIPEAEVPTAASAALSLARHHEKAVLVDSYTNLARSLARRMAHRGERIEDLEQVALLALIRAADRYDPERGRPFAAFATASITGELKRHFRDRMWTVRVPRSVQEMHLAIRAAREELTQAHGASPTIPQIAHYLGTTEEHVLFAMEAATNSWARSLDIPSTDGDTPATEIPVTDAGFDRFLDRQLLIDSVAHLSPTERLILHRVFFDGRTQRQVAEELHVSQMQISRLMTRTLGKLKHTFEAA